MFAAAFRTTRRFLCNPAVAFMGNICECLRNDGGSAIIVEFAVNLSLKFFVFECLRQYEHVPWHRSRYSSRCS
ncbi:hypothetical protein SISSUDRAFT_593032 [Sistotremastrum suecicum HHB10207 ss-3]|uniref:Uncharacterized protein n=1 Tax=Sistotremastrum suecicum HHB10207 ss-3 TaxID=1314776 RepID=A0A165XBE8_9AGAM|nr:hypothetical protein SISSUDRAFT_593032 [Sistotremastrum suecicum HHB10207 ss-3]